MTVNEKDVKRSDRTKRSLRSPWGFGRTTGSIHNSNGSKHWLEFMQACSTSHTCLPRPSLTPNAGPRVSPLTRRQFPHPCRALWSSVLAGTAAHASQSRGRGPARPIPRQRRMGDPIFPGSCEVGGRSSAWRTCHSPSFKPRSQSGYRRLALAQLYLVSGLALSVGAFFFSAKSLETQCKNDFSSPQ